MVQKIAGYIIAGIGLIGLGYFRRYHGTVIPYPFLWLIVSGLVCIAGIWMVGSAGKKKLLGKEQEDDARVDKLMRSGEKILLTTGNCETKENSYHREIDNESMSKAEMLDASFYPNRNYRQEFIEQSAIIYQYQGAGKQIRMVSQSFPFSKNSLTAMVENKQLHLYINPFDKNDYVFVAGK